MKRFFISTSLALTGLFLFSCSAKTFTGSSGGTATLASAAVGATDQPVVPDPVVPDRVVPVSVPVSPVSLPVPAVIPVSVPAVTPAPSVSPVPVTTASAIASSCDGKTPAVYGKFIDFVTGAPIAGSIIQLKLGVIGETPVLATSVLGHDGTYCFDHLQEGVAYITYALLGAPYKHPMVNVVYYPSQLIARVPSESAARGLVWTVDHFPNNAGGGVMVH